ncbi:MAG: bifunctional adenosylcobinamide kinase/adenosylcobinamide-phosphate guanylyltransferase [Ekhidna sp.]|nr:bifunctional adenosylcobinamide kinase/adenosylcobinamide-phosphate guanylyltransferase [Ekhidna sp.]MBC6427330.1 bifunctional adenosylcobinamide kinase/adenosylcobinamide-phosphate guanylyltransferase [Ekhidna sp.]
MIHSSLPYKLIYYISGGARSGKSSYAMKRAKSCRKN